MTNKPEMAQAEIPEIIKDPTRSNTNYERGRFLGKVKLRNFFQNDRWENVIRFKQIHDIDIRWIFLTIDVVLKTRIAFNAL